MAGKREEQMKEITERLEQGVQELFTSEKYTAYLKTMSQFHNYSFNNTVLIASQKPEATLVAGYATWGKKFNRQVKRGEKGIKIIAPVPVRTKEEIEKFDPETNEPVLRPDGQPETEEVEHIIPRFRVATVFDISQTYGDPIPELDTPELLGSVENFDIFMEAIQMASPAPMRYAEIEGDSKGYYSSANKEIVIQEGMSGKQTMKTAVHEVTHAMCHDRDVMEELGEKKNQMTREVEAESVAFTVCSFFNLDTSDYSFPYIAGWSSDMDMKELRSSMDFIRKTAGDFIDSMAENIQKLQKDKEAERKLGEDDLVFQVSALDEDTKKFYLVDNVGRVDFLRLLHIFAGQDKGNGNPVQFLKSHGVHLDLWRDSENLQKNQELPGFYDVLYMDADHIVDAAAFSILIQVEMMVSRAEYGHTALGREAHNLAVQYAYKLDNPRDTRELVKQLAEAAENPGVYNIQEIMEDAQAEIDALPDSQIGLMQMHEFGYRNDSILPLTMERAVVLHNAGLNIYSLNKDGSRALMDTEAAIRAQEGIFGIEDREWQSHRVMESVRGENMEGEHLDEDLFFSSSQDRYAIYQTRDDSKGREYLFMGMEYLKTQGFSVEYDDYRMVYSDALGENETLDSLYEKFNIGRPLDFKGHSLSVSDIVALKRDGEVTAHYVDSYGYTELPDFFPQKEKYIGQGKEAEPLENSPQMPENADTGEKIYPPLYTHTLTYAMEHGRADDYLESRKLNLDCKKAIEDAIRENFDGMYLKHDAAMGVMEEYGAERATFILANTVQRLDYDGRFSASNKAWAKGYGIPENVTRGMDMNADYVVASHPAVLDGFIRLARDWTLEHGLEKKADIQVSEGTKGFIADGHFGTWHMVEAKEISGEQFFRMEHEEYGDSVASIIVSREGELVAEDLEHGFDQGAMEAIDEYFSEKGIEMGPETVETETETQEDLQEAQAEAGEKGKLPLISDRTEPEPALNGQSCAVVEETVLSYAQAQIDGMGLSEEVELLGARVYGSRSREGMYREGSDIDVVVSYSGELKEDAFFNALHEDGLKIAGIPVDINPVSTEKTGTLGEYLENAEKYLDEKQGGMENPGNEKSAQAGQEAAITFYVAECTEFPVLGEYHERLETLQEAMELYEKIPAERMNGIKGIGFCLEDGSIYDGNFDLMVMGEMQTEFINEIPQYRDSPLVQKAIAEMEGILQERQAEKNTPETEKKPLPSKQSELQGKEEISAYTGKDNKPEADVQESGGGIPSLEEKPPEPEKTAENALKTDRNLSGGSRKQSVLNALRERQARMKAQEKEKQGQEKQAKKKGEQEL